MALSPSNHGRLQSARRLLESRRERGVAHLNSQLAPLECTAKQLRHWRMARMSP